jgi:hypothetical protein
MRWDRGIFNGLHGVLKGQNTTGIVVNLLFQPYFAGLTIERSQRAATWGFSNPGGEL